MYKEYALYKANRDMLDKRYSLKTEEQRLRDIEFKQKIDEYEQNMKIELENAKNMKMEEIDRKTDQVVMDKYKDVIHKLKLDIDERQKKLEKTEEENKLMSATIEELEEYKSRFNVSSAQCYNYINNCQVKFDKDFKLNLNDLRQQKQQESLKILSVSKLPNIKMINLGCFKNDDKEVLNFVQNSFPDSLDKFCFNWNCIDQINVKFFIDVLANSLPKVTEAVYFHKLKMDYDDLSTIVKASSNAQRLVFNNCLIKSSGKLDLTIGQKYNTHLLSFRYTGDKGRSDWGENKAQFEDIITAINCSELTQSLDTLDVKGCRVDPSKVTVGNANVIELGPILPMED